MRAAAHFDHAHDLPQLALHFDIPLNDDVVSQERDQVSAELQISERHTNFGCHEHRHSGTGERSHHAVQRLAEVLAECWGECELEAGQRIDHDTLSIEPPYACLDLQERLIHR